ncbi:MAG: ATP-binding cassette domain-containing protein [Oscillospiraceae bacterium]|jgi:ABC-type lipoprotein export system ATPase subunit|nr:ATP-binding cassette domain-containing protein [Oscillospiraceae bacterium]
MPVIETLTLRRLMEEYPVTRDFFQNLNIPPLDREQPLASALIGASDDWLLEFGLTREEIPEQLAEFLRIMTASEEARPVKSLTILGGFDKMGAAEDVSITIDAGTVVSIVGPTGSGKSRLLGDIECLAQGDTPTGRRILIDGEAVDEDERFRLEGKIVAQLSQNMNFVMDLTVGEFLEMHARSRAVGAAGSGQTPGELIQTCFERANSLAGEKFTPDTKVTQLSGGQSRALMIADCAYISRSAIVLIDEIENAGVDRREAIELLARAEKIVLISTHDPLLALGADKRVVIKNGGIFKILETSPEEKESLAAIEKIDRLLTDTRAALRSGERVLLKSEANERDG